MGRGQLKYRSRGRGGGGGGGRGRGGTGAGTAGRGGKGVTERGSSSNGGGGDETFLDLPSNQYRFDGSSGGGGGGGKSHYGEDAGGLSDMSEMLLSGEGSAMGSIADWGTMDAADGHVGGVYGSGGGGRGGAMPTLSLDIDRVVRLLASLPMATRLGVEVDYCEGIATSPGETFDNYSTTKNASDVVTVGSGCQSGTATVNDGDTQIGNANLKSRTTYADTYHADGASVSKAAEPRVIGQAAPAPPRAAASAIEPSPLPQRHAASATRPSADEDIQLDELLGLATPTSKMEGEDKAEIDRRHATNTDAEVEAPGRGQKQTSATVIPLQEEEKSQNRVKAATNNKKTDNSGGGVGGDDSDGDKWLDSLLESG